MNFIDRVIAFGFGVLLLDFVAWRFLKIKDERAKFTIRLALFAMLCYVLWTCDISPFHIAPWPEGSTYHVFAQCLEFLWWLQAAQIISVVLRKVILPTELHRDRLLQDVLQAVVFLAAGVAAIAYVLKLPVGGLLATSGAFAIIVGLAVQSTLSDVFSGVVLNATKPFHVGDFVSIGDTHGEVVERTWRATTLLSEQGNFVVVPNSTAAKANIINQSRPPQMHGVRVKVRVSPAFRPAMVVSALEDAIVATAGVLVKPKASVNAQIIRRRFIEYEILAYISSAARKFATQNEIIDQVHRHLGARGIDIDIDKSSFKDLGARERLLRGIEMFRSLTDEQMIGLSRAMEPEIFFPDEIIYQAGPNCPDKHRALYIVSSGVAAMLTQHQGKDVELRRIGPGDAVGRAGLLTGITINIKLRAVGRVSVFRLQKEALTPILQQYPEIGKEMLESLMDYQAQEAEITREVPAHATEKDTLFNRLLLGMWRLHGMT